MKMTWSYSSLSLFQQCPRKYYHLRVVKDHKEPETTAILYGKEVHLAAEEYIRDGKPIPPQFSQFKEALDVLNNIPGEKLCEYKMGLTKDLQACGFFDENVWFRGVADLLVINGDLAYIVDYKTGKSSQFADAKQLELMALAVFKHFPEVKKAKAGLAFLVAEDFVKANYDVEESPTKWIKWIQETDRLAKAHETGVWNPKQNFTCRKYCLVKSCEHNGKGYYR
jgi:hypothetical protein